MGSRAVLSRAASAAHIDNPRRSCDSCDAATHQPTGVTWLVYRAGVASSAALFGDSGPGPAPRRLVKSRYDAAP